MQFFPPRIQLLTCRGRWRCETASRSAWGTTVAGTPPPETRWLKDGQPLPPQLRGGSEQPGQLFIPSATPEDSGKYSLVASSVAGETRHSFQVKVVSLVVSDEGWQDQVDVIDGKEFGMKCPVTGDVTGIKWYKDGKSIAEVFTFTRSDQTHVVFGDGGRSLRIPEVVAEDSGQYTCEAETEAGSVKFSTKLNVLVPPRFGDPFHEPRESVLTEHEQLQLDCQVDGYPAPQVRWFKDGLPIPEDSVRQVMVSADGEKLTLRGQLGVAGDYSCEVVNSAGTARRQFPVRVKVAPRPAGPDPQRVTVFRGDTVTLNCSVVGAPPPRNVWNKDGRQVVGVSWADPEFAYYPLLGELSDRLLVSSARLSDAGQFECIGKNRLGEARRRIQLIVNGVPVIDGAGEEVRRLPVIPGDSITLSCPVQSYPLATVTWTKDGEVVKVITPPELDDGVSGSGSDELPFDVPAATRRRRRRRRDIEVPDLSTLLGAEEAAAGGRTAGDPAPPTDRFSPGDTSLTLSSVRPDDDGLYTCTASNEHGRAAIQASVQVLEAPTILESPSERRVVLHDSAALTCEAIGTPPPVVSWFKDGEPISELSIPHLYESADGLEVLVQLASPEMAGTYTCEALNAAGKASRDTLLTVVEPPEIVVPDSTDLSVVESDGQTLTCQLATARPAGVSWMHNGRPLGQLPHRLRDQNRTLLIPSMKREDAGQFTCLASNEAGQDELTYSVEVLVPPYFDDDVAEYEEKVHRSIVLRCPVVAIPHPDITWYKGEEPVPATSGWTVSAHGHLLRIASLRPEHAGDYTCHARNVLAEASWTVSLAVLEPPSISPPLPSLLLTPGEPLEVPCVATGQPPPRISWYSDRPELSSDGSLVDEGGTLRAAAARTEHSGLYTCLAWNGVGLDRAQVFVAVIAPPTLDPADRERTVLEHEATAIRCPLDRLDLDSDVVWFRDGIELWGNTSSLIISADDRTLLLPAVQLADAAAYMCRAENEIGRARHEVLLRVLVPPRLKDYPERLEALQGEDVVIGCDLEASEPAAERIWRRDGRPIDTNDRVQLLPSGALQLRNVTSEDAASYTCRAHNEAGEAVRRAALDVLTPPSAAVEADTVTVLEGDPLRLMCDASGNPEPEVSWWRTAPGQESTATLSDLWTFAPYMASDNHIYKQSSELGDAGLFHCKAVSEVGRASVDVRVTVVSPPAFVDASVPTELVVRAGESTLLDCRNTGQPPAKVIWLRDGMELPAVVGDQEHTLSLPSLAPTDAGDYTCIAVNEAGKLKREFSVKVLSVPSVRRSEN
ncbi:hemicentin-1-like, partial [Pollicipes pollicipes]|uniref:hemicentin-1-like n=1 Tax=Pollicipes pollicipes TaxID=41117 RepID=UPI0018859103